MQRTIAASLATLLVAGQVGPGVAEAQNQQRTATPIKHLVVIFQENVSFDHYFGTYPNATNPGNELGHADSSRCSSCEPGVGYEPPAL